MFRHAVSAKQSMFEIGAEYKIGRNAEAKNSKEKNDISNHVFCNEQDRLI